METKTTKTDIEYREYQATVDRDGRIVYFLPESPNALYTKDALPKSAKIAASSTKAPVKAPPKVAPSTNSTVDYYTKRVQAKEQAYKESVERDKASCKGMAISDPTSDKTIQAKSELNEAKKALQYEVYAQSQINK